MNGDKQFIDENSGDPISTAISALPRVTAPDGFESNVFRQIRVRAPERPAGMPWLKVAVPTAALALLASFFWFSSISTNEIQSIVVVEDPNGRKTASPDLGSDLHAAGTTATDQNRISASSPVEKDLTARRSNSENAENLVGLPSIDLGAGQPSRPILPRGFDTESKPFANAQGVGQTTTVTLADVVQTLGIRTAFRGGEFVADSVTASGLASRAGVRSGDVIEAVNDVPFSSTATMTVRVEIHSIRVRRDGRSLTLRL